MFAKINHLAITSDNYSTNAKFYEALFGMKTSSKGRPARAVPVGDGQIGLNNIPRREGRRSGLDHFGFEVEDIELALSRIKKFDPSLEAVKRPSVRPNAAYSAHDPDVNVFDLAGRNSGQAKDIFAENNWTQDRYIDHIALRTRNAERCADFYVQVFELKRLNHPKDDNYYLSDGRVTLMITPWRMSDFVGHDPMPLGLEHIGFRVESIDALKRDIDELVGVNPRMMTRPLGYGSEGKARLELFQRCPLGCHHLTDIEGVYIDVSESQDAKPA
jgi:catechol 2,3-dioxygenase-like lactoylglutathione lyase family enzyme